MHLVIFTQIILSSIDTRQRRKKGILNIFQKGSVFELHDYHFWEYRFTLICCVKVWVYEWLDQKWLSIHFLFLSKHDINSVLKIPIANFCRLINPQNMDMAGVWPPKISTVYGSLVCGCSFSWIKVQGASETVYCMKFLTLVLRLVGVLSKQLAEPLD